MMLEQYNFKAKNISSPISEHSSAMPILFFPPGNFLEGLGVDENMPPCTFPVDESCPIKHKKKKKEQKNK